MALLDKIGRILSNGKYIATHTLFSCVHSDSNTDRTVEDIDNDLEDCKGTELSEVRVSMSKSSALFRFIKKNLSQVEATLGFADTSYGGLMSATDKAKLDGIEAGAQKNVTVPVATTSANGLMSSSDKIKLDAYPNATKVDVYSIYDRVNGSVVVPSPIYSFGIQIFINNAKVEQFAFRNSSYLYYAIVYEVTNRSRQFSVFKFSDYRLTTVLHKTFAQTISFTPTETSSSLFYVYFACAAYFGIVGASQYHIGLMSVADKKKLDNLTIDLSQYEQSGKTLPTIQATFVYKTYLTHHRTVFVEDIGYQHVFCCVHDEEQSSDMIGYKYIVYTGNTLNYVTTYDLTNDDEVPDYILRAFGEANATPTLDGTMSAKDKKKLDALKEAIELPTTSGIDFHESPFYTLGGELVNNVAYYKKEEVLRPGQLSVSHYIVVYFGGVYYRYVRGLADTFGYKYSLKDTYTDADVISEISSLFQASATKSGLMSADDKVLLNEHSILLNDFKIRTFTMEVDVDGNEIRGYEGTIGTFHVKKDEIFKVKDLAEQPLILSGTITSSDGFDMPFSKFNPAVADKDYYGTFTIKLSGKYKVAVSLV